MKLSPNQVFYVLNAYFTIPLFNQHLTILHLFPHSRGFLPLQMISSEDWWTRRWYALLPCSIYCSRTRKKIFSLHCLKTLCLLLISTVT